MTSAIARLEQELADNPVLLNADKKTLEKQGPDDIPKTLIDNIKILIESGEHELAI